MSLTIPQLEEIVKLYIHATTEESQIEYNNILNEWRSSNEYTSTVLEIIQGQTNYKSLILYASYTLINHIDHITGDEYTHEDYLNIYNVCYEQIKNNPNTPPSDTVMRNMITLCAYSTFFSSDSALLEQFQEFSPNILIYYLDDLLIKDNDPKRIAEGAEHIFTNFDIFFDALSKAEVCSQTFNLMKTLTKKCGISFISHYIPSFQIGLEKGNSTASILELYDVLKSIEPCNLIDEEIPLIKDIVIILIDYTDKIEDTKLSSAIWKEIIDMSFDFFCLEGVGNEYSNFVFTNFHKALQFYIENDIEEFYVLFDTYAENIECVPQNSDRTMMISYIEDFYQFVITIVNIDLQFCNDEISKPLFMISDMHSLQPNEEDEEEDEERGNENENEEEENDDQFYINVLTQFYRKNLDNLSQGYIYAFSYAPIEIIKILSSNIAIQITSSLEPPPTTVYFVTKCCKYLGDSIENLIQICFKFFDVINVKDIGDSLVSFSKYYPDLFISKLDDYFPVIFEVMKESDMKSVMPYFIALFTLFPLIKIEEGENKETQELFNVCGGLFLNNIIDPTSNLDVFCDDISFIQGIISKVKPGTSEIMKSFINSLFDQILEIFSPLLTSQDSIVQEKLCLMIADALHNNWVNDRDKILEWINVVILDCPNEKHFSVLGELMDLLPTKEFKEFISKTDEMTDEMIKSEILFFSYAFKMNSNLVVDLPIDLILFYLTKDKFFRLTFDFLRKMISCKDISLSEEDVKKVLDQLIHCFFELCCGDDLPDCLRLIRSIAEKYIGLEAMLQGFLQIIGTYNENDVATFCQSFMESPNEKYFDDGLCEIAGKIVQYYRKSHKTE